jgi:hypothetical protein
LLWQLKEAAFDPDSFRFSCGFAVSKIEVKITSYLVHQMSAFKQRPTRPNRQPLAHLGHAALWQNLAESGWSGLGATAGESGRFFQVLRFYFVSRQTGPKATVDLW